MKVIVLGAGVIGVSTAYELACDGHEVTVIDRQNAVAQETSLANGGQLSFNHGPLAQPGAVLKALKWLGKKDAPLLYRLRMDAQLWDWSLKFIASCADPQFFRNAEQVLRLALYSRERMHHTMEREHIAFSHTRTGILTLYQNPKDFGVAREQTVALRELGCEREILGAEDCLNKEPALKYNATPLAGGTYAPFDESGDCHVFTEALAESCKKRGVTFQLNTNITGLKREDWHIDCVETDQGDIDGDVYVMALGSYSPLFLRSLGIKLPIYPAKGYSVTLPVKDDEGAPKMSMTSYDDKLVFSRLGNKLRAAGMLEFGGYDTHLDEQRARVVLQNTMKLFPRGIEAEHAEFWTGLRPQTPDSIPVVGRGAQENLVINTGHGMLGWTMAMGTARIAADLAGHIAPEIEVGTLGWERFA